MIKRCPHCGQPMPEPKKRVRSCFDCGEPIRLHDKWQWVERNGVLTCAHRHCGHPQSYEPNPAEPTSALLFAGDAA